MTEPTLPHTNFSINAFSSNMLLGNLSTSIQNYQQNLNDFTEYLQENIGRNKKIKCHCKQVLSESLAQLKSTFGEFAE